MINSNVTLRCVFINRKGLAQWAKGGQGLGTNRTLPFNPRFSITGGVSGNEEEYSLRIINVQLEDDGAYSCQVLPTNPTEEHLFAEARLSVMAAPDDPYIENYSNNSQVEALYTDKFVNLTCVAENGRPAAQLTWYKNGRKVTENVQYTTQDYPDSKRVTARSQIAIPVADNYRELNGKEYKCVASGMWTTPLKPTVVRLNIFYPPGAPVISGYNNQSLDVGETLPLTCVSTGGNPVGFLKWKRNGVYVHHHHTSVGDSATSVYDLHVKASDHNTVYTCEVSTTKTLNISPLTASYTLSVNFPPERVTMHGNYNHVREGEDITMGCTTAEARPKATITWFIGDKQVTNNLAVTETYQRQSNGVVITTSTYKFKALATLNNKVVHCQAKNTGRTEVADKKTLNILFPPTSLKIRDLNEPSLKYVHGKTLTVKAEKSKTLECVAQGGNPQADLTWFRGNTKIDDVFVPRNGPIAKSLLELHFQPEDNGAVYKCEANNNASVTRKVKQVTFSVMFPPKTVNITGHNRPASVGQEITLECQCSSSNPPAKLTWKKNRHRLIGTNPVTENGENGGKRSSSVLKVIASPRDHNSVFSCSAWNERLEQTVTNAITLQVLFKPQFDTNALPSTLHMRHGQRISINLTAVANPQTVTYVIFKDGAPLSTLPGHFNMSAGVLTISKVKKSDKGSYMVKASNIEGTTEFRFTAVVKYQATVSRVSPTQSVDEGRQVSFVCEADAYPVVPNMFSWFREGFDMSRFIEKQEGKISTLTIQHLKREDAGKFKCTVDNRVGSPSHRFAELIVKFSPVIDKAPELSRSAGRPGTDVTIYCNADGAPQVHITWTRNNSQVRPNAKFEVDTTNVGPKYKSKLKIKSVSSNDYGAYVCTATNSKGSDSHSIALGGTSLQKNVEYEITVLAFNEKGKSLYPVPGITVKTLEKEVPADVMTSDLQGSDETPVIIILVVCIVGVFILTLNVGLILFFIRKRKKRLEGSSDTTSHTNTFELYGSAKNADHNIYHPPPSDDTRSYGTYDKSMDDFSDDYIRDYDRECETHVFLPPLQSDYPGSRPYSPSHKLAPIDSPRLLGGGHKMTTYIADDKPGRISPWSEDPYKRSTPTYRKGSYENGIPNGDVYEFKSARGKGMNELSERPTNRPPSRSGKTPPPPPVRSSSRCGTLGLAGSKSDFLSEEADDNDDRCRPSSRPPLPARNYLPQEILSSPTTPTSFCSPHSSPPPVPRYGPMPGSSSILSPNIVPNPNYSGPVSSFGSSNGGINHHSARTTTASINHQHQPPPSSRTSPSSYNSNSYITSSTSNLHRQPHSPHNTVPAGSEFRGHLV
ncbi:down syndrome cell adhesion molecule [Elysia marginata]|uniref:Down syndrome cell adhesion molecule n=1 Tax=Elysia marginata TaxID=1093978 RepID=A0AAV4GVG5_9GAST|nr:down syndrome cell adhesion molecule [Elysia marginata]